MNTPQENILSPEEIRDTKDLQLFTLEAYMRQLGYIFTGTFFDKYPRFESFEYKNKSRRHISFMTAVKLYNGGCTDWHGERYKTPFDFDLYSIRKAEAAKVLRKVNLQLDKHTGYIKAQSNFVTWTHPVYYKMFIASDKYFPF